MGFGRWQPPVESVNGRTIGILPVLEPLAVKITGLTPRSSSCAGTTSPSSSRNEQTQLLTILRLLY
jgi:hypothetical protein